MEVELNNYPELLTIEEAAAYLRISRTLGYQLARQYRTTNGVEGLPVIRLGRCLRVPRRELAKLLEEARDGQILDGYDFTLLSNTLELGGASIEDAVVPLDRVATAPANASVAEIEQSMAASGHSRLALTGDKGDLIGWVHAKDLLSVDDQVWSEPLPTHRRRRLIPVDHRMAVEDALEMLQTNRQHFALATASGKPIGIITLEDVLRVLVSGLAGAQERVAESNGHSH